MRIVWIAFLLLSALNLDGMEITMLKKDSAGINVIRKDPELFYDSLAVKANRHRLTKWLYGYLISSVNDSINRNLESYEYYKSFEKKTIGSIEIKSLEVFGPDFSDTSKITNIWIEKMANKMHSKSNLNVIRKNLWIKEGQTLDPDLLMDNERLLRSLPYLNDVKISIKSRPGNDQVVDMLILTKDVFSFGISGSISNIYRGDIGIYDKNILGIGHEIGMTLFGHIEQKPHLGIEAYYAINNVKGNFINFAAGYANNYIRNSLFVSFERDFLRPQSVYAGGITATRSFRTNTISLNENVAGDSLSYLFLDAWYGRRLKRVVNPNDTRFQINISGRIRYTSFYHRPPPDAANKQFFSNSTFYLGSMSFSRRSYVRDYLVYSYGITEDIPKGYLHELVLGYDNNEFGNRLYSHLFLSTGNLFKRKPFYLYTSLGLGSFWNKSGAEQGMFDAKVNFISPLFELWGTKVRQFIKMNYTLGINRFEAEHLLIRNNSGIRGFGSRVERGKQRLTLNVENVFFQKKSVLKFQTAFFSFIKQDFFAGVGLGIRIRNESLIFKTIQMRLAFYPNHPGNVHAVGFIMDEVYKSRFYTFQPRGPEPLRFE